ncbi:MAG TPA: GntR family transcriptional regulator [Gaiellaceae bacterium]|nr:GntR family transcriptional regulator [Gaiellaceae bacterium]
MSETWNLPTIERSSTIEQTHRLLRDAIVEGSIPQGTHLRELHLANTLRTSRGTVREAIRQLVQEGLAEYQLHRGTFVRAFSPGDRLDVYVAREAIEVGVATRLLDMDGELDLRGMKEALGELRRAAKNRTRPTERVMAADVRFHRELVALAQSPRLDRAYETLSAETRMLLRHHPVYPWRRYVADHEQLLDAVRDRDVRLPELVAAHLRLSADLIGSELAAEAIVG